MTWKLIDSTVLPTYGYICTDNLFTARTAKHANKRAPLLIYYCYLSFASGLDYACLLGGLEKLPIGGGAEGGTYCVLRTVVGSPYGQSEKKESPVILAFSPLSTIHHPSSIHPESNPPYPFPHHPPLLWWLRLADNDINIHSPLNHPPNFFHSTHSPKSKSPFFPFFHIVPPLLHLFLLLPTILLKVQSCPAILSGCVSVGLSYPLGHFLRSSPEINL